jgi:hypothetical protein
MIFGEGRNLNSRSPHRRVGYISCPWLQNIQLQYESLLELNFARIALLCPHVVAIRSQPFKLDLGNGTHYTPDFQLTFRSGYEITCEVKPKVFVAQHREKLLLAQSVLSKHKIDFLLIADSHIYAEDRHERASTFIRFARANVLDTDLSQAKQLIGQLTFPISIDEIFAETGISKPMLFHLIGIRFLSIESDLYGHKVSITNNIKENDDYLSARTWIGGADRRLEF